MSFNRYMVECESILVNFLLFPFMPVLIDTWWNVNSRFVTELAVVDNPRLERLRKADHNIHAPALPAASGFPGCAADQKRGVCSGCFQLYTRMSFARILNGFYSICNIWFPFPAHI